jgi:hypothetical protein
MNRVDLNWSDVQLTVNGTIYPHEKSGIIHLGDVINLSAVVGTGAYSVSLQYQPTNTHLGTYIFTGGTIPTVVFTKIDQASVNTLTVESVTPSNLQWSDITLQINMTIQNPGLSGVIKTGDVIDLTALAGNGTYVVTIMYSPTNTLLGMFWFTST